MLEAVKFNDFQITNCVTFSLTVFTQRDIVIFLLSYHHCILDLFDAKFYTQFTEKEACFVHVKYIA